jgi:hypothetical protein
METNANTISPGQLWQNATANGPLVSTQRMASRQTTILARDKWPAVGIRADLWSVASPG